MADVQKEKGWTPIADELLEALARTYFKDHESRIIHFVIRKTFGWDKSWVRLSLTQIMEGTGITDRSNVSKCIHRLVDRRILERKGPQNRKGYKLKLQKDYDLWIRLTGNGSLNRQQLSKQTTVGQITNDEVG